MTLYTPTDTVEHGPNGGLTELRTRLSNARGGVP
jgi:hypothetical protein